MILVDNIISKSLLAGITIGIGGFLYISSPSPFMGNSPILGAFLFSLGLLSVILFQLNLFTGKSGFLTDKSDLRRLILVLIFNIIGAFLFGLLVRFLDTDIVDKANNIINNRLSTPITVYIIKSIITGFLMTLAVESETKQNSNHLILIMSIMAFILTGCFHCIADSFYYGVSDITYNNILSLLLRLLIVIVFNFIGCNLYNLFVYKNVLNK